jgi:RND family efflux transporter MFP subunit
MKTVFLAPLFLVLAAGCTKHETAPRTASLPAVRVRVASVQAADVPRLTEVTGTIRPVRRAVLAAKVMGAITELPVTLGQRVRANDVLLKIFSAEANAKLVRARSEFNVARRDLERERSLQAKGASTAETVRNLEDRFTGAEAMVREAEAQLSYTELRAPFDGVIARKMVNAGDLANPGQPLLEVEETENFEVEANIPDSFAATLTPGTRLAAEAGRIPFTGTLREISSTADAATRSIGVKIAVPTGAAVRSGQFTRVQVPGAAIRTLLVPAAAVSVSGQMERVFVVGADNRAVLRLVKTGATRDERIEILTGLAENERVVLAPPAGLREGQPLEVQL